MGEKYKALLVGSSGGHLMQLMRVKDKVEKYCTTTWVCFDKPDARYFLRDRRTYWCYFPTTRNYINLIKNSAQAIRVLRRERPDVIISSGASVALPYFLFGKLIGAKTIYIESFTRVTSPSLTGRLAYPLSDLFCYQWEGMKRFYPKGVCIGRLP